MSFVKRFVYIIVSLFRRVHCIYIYIYTRDSTVCTVYALHYISSFVYIGGMQLAYAI